MESSKTVNPDSPLIQENRLIRDIYFTGPLFLESLSINMRGKPLYLPFATSRKTPSLLFRKFNYNRPFLLRKLPRRPICIRFAMYSHSFILSLCFSLLFLFSECEGQRVVIDQVTCSKFPSNKSRIWKLAYWINRRRSLRPYENSGRNGHYVGQRSCGADQPREWGGETEDCREGVVASR